MSPVASPWTPSRPSRDGKARGAPLSAAKLLTVRFLRVAEQEGKMDKERALSQLREALGHQRLTRPRAKAEILLGLLAAGLGIFLGEWAFGRAGDDSWLLAAARLLL